MMLRKSIDPAPGGRGKNCIFRLFIYMIILSICLSGCTTKNAAKEREQASQGRQFSNSQNENAAKGTKLRILEEQRQALQDKIKQQRQVIYELAQEYGTTNLNDRYDAIQKRVDTLQNELTKIENNRAGFEEQTKELEQKTDKTTDEQQKISVMRIELDVIKKEEIQMREVISKEGARLITLSRKQQAIDKYQAELMITKKSYDTVCEKIKELSPTPAQY